MHVGQILLVEADTAEDALSSVQSSVLWNEVPNPSWSDWCQIGGRWEGEFDGENVMQYSANTERAEEFIQKQLEFRKTEIEYLREKSEKVSLDEAASLYDPEGDQFKYSLDVYFHEKLAKVLQDDWTSDSYVYDLESYTASLKYFRERLAKDPEKQFLVMVDFHF